MRVLWVCNVVLPEFCEEFQIRRTVVGGWMEGMLAALRARDACEVALAFPIRDEARRHDGVHDDIRYYAFDASHDAQLQSDAESEPMIAEFLRILEDCQPDVLQVWGTEYPHAWAMLQACRRLGMEQRLVCHLQGILFFFQKSYSIGLPDTVVHEVDARGNSIARDIAAFRRQARREVEVLRRAGFVLGRTFWDESCVRVLQPDARYRFCEEILRPAFYEAGHRWSLQSCVRHRIFLSQASYPIKGFHFVLPAIQILSAWYPDLHVFVGGTNPMQQDAEGQRSTYGAYLHELSERLDVGSCITFLGQLSAEEMREQYLQAHVFVSASTIENSPNSVAEALMLGVPVVASLVGGLATLIEHGRSGLLYQADAPYMLAAYVRQVFEDDALAGALSMEARETMRERHDPTRIVGQVLSIYQEASRERSR